MCHQNILILCIFIFCVLSHIKNIYVWSPTCYVTSLLRFKRLLGHLNGLKLSEVQLESWQGHNSRHLVRICNPPDPPPPPTTPPSPRQIHSHCERNVLFNNCKTYTILKVLMTDLVSYVFFLIWYAMQIVYKYKVTG